MFVVFLLFPSEEGWCPEMEESGLRKGVITKGVFSLGESPESLKSLNSLNLWKMVSFSFVFHNLGVL